MHTWNEIISEIIAKTPNTIVRNISNLYFFKKKLRSSKSIYNFSGWYHASLILSVAMPTMRYII